MLFKISDTWWGFYLFIYLFYILGPQLRREDNVGPSKPHAFSIRSVNESLADYEKNMHAVKVFIRLHELGGWCYTAT